MAPKKDRCYQKVSCLYIKLNFVHCFLYSNKYLNIDIEENKRVNCRSVKIKDEVNCIVVLTIFNSNVMK